MPCSKFHRQFRLFFFLLRIIGIPLIIIAGFTFWGLFNQTANKCIEVIKTVGVKVVKDGYAITKKGVKKLMDFISKYIAPKVSEIWNKVKAYFTKLKEESTEIHQDQDATIQA